MLAIMTRFTGRVPTINFDESSSVPLAFIGELTDEFSPSHITHCFRQAVIFNHVLDCQTLYANHLVFVDDARREFVLVVSSSVRDTSMHTSYFETGLVSVLGTLLFLRVSALGLCQAFFILCIVAGIAYGLTSRENDHRRETQIQPNMRIGDRKRFHLLLNQQGDKIAVCAIFGDRDRAWIASFGQIAMEGDCQRLAHLGKGKLLILPLEGVRGIGGRLSMVLVLESRILSSPLEEVDEGLLQVPEGLLKGYTGYLCQPGIDVLEIRQHASESMVVELLAMLLVGRRFGRQSPIVHEAATPERLREDALLFVGWVESELVGPLRLTHWLLAFLLFSIALDGLDWWNKHLVSLLWAKYRLVVAMRGAISVASRSCFHAHSIAEKRNDDKGKVLVGVSGAPAPGSKQRLASLPMPQMRVYVIKLG